MRYYYHEAVIKMSKQQDFDWKLLLQEQQNSGLNMKKFCRENNISYTNFKNHKYMLKKQDTHVDLIPIKLEHQDTLKLLINGTELLVDSKMDDLSLRRILKALFS